MKIIPDLGIQIPQIYLPRPGTDLTRWAVIACDQFTSQPEYWNEVEKIVGDAPSTLNLTFPEVYLEKPGGEDRIRNIQSTMHKYMDEGILQPHDGLVYVERTVGGKTRKGIVLALDLEAYDYNKGSSSLIRATEGTIVDRLPPRIKIREAGMKNGVRLLAIGDTRRLPAILQEELQSVVDATQHNRQLTVLLALSYGGREDIVRAARTLARRARDGDLDPDAIDETRFAASLSTADVPDPDLLIRTSGEM